MVRWAFVRRLKRWSSVWNPHWTAVVFGFLRFLSHKRYLLGRWSRGAPAVPWAPHLTSCRVTVCVTVRVGLGNVFLFAQYQVTGSACHMFWPEGKKGLQEPSALKKVDLIHHQVPSFSVWHTLCLCPGLTVWLPVICFIVDTGDILLCLELTFNSWQVCIDDWLLHYLQ